METLDMNAKYLQKHTANKVHGHIVSVYTKWHKRSVAYLERVKGWQGVWRQKSPVGSKGKAPVKVWWSLRS